MISFAKINTKSAYEALTPVQDRLYFIDETGELYMNGKPYNGDDGSRDWLCFTAGESSSTVKLNKSTSQTPTISLEYSTDGINWTAYTWNNLTGATITLASIGDKVYFRGDNSEFSKNTQNHYEFAMSGTIYATGNIMSLISKDCSKTAFNASNQRLTHLFKNCTSLVTPPRLPATTLCQSVYYSMFEGCTSLAVAPELPATDLGSAYTYSFMFQNCTSLTKAPDLPATTLINNCYNAMFKGCTSLAVAPDLPATTLANNCYQYMFQDCTSLVSIPARLPATTMANYCYNAMFKGCSALQKPPVLPATTLADNCYSDMFANTGLTEVCALPATTLANSCYGGMFAGTKITTVPANLLPATTLVGYCYQWMFSGCTSLTIGCWLPATTLQQNCYAHMYEGCTSLTDSESINMTTFASGSCYQMFKGCTKLCRLKAPNFTSWDESATSQWLYGLSNLKRAFVCNANLDTTTRNENRIPEGWIPTRSAYGADALIPKWNIGSNNITFAPTNAEQDLITVNQNITLNAIELPSGYVGTAQAFINWTWTNVTLTAGEGIDFVDTPRERYLSRVLITWDGTGNAKLRVMWETAL